MTEKRILIIDTDTRYRRNLLLNLKQEGYQIETTGSLTEAIKKMVREIYDCVIMDVKLPEIKGYEAISIIKSIDPKVRVIMTTNKNSISLETKVRSQDIYYYFIKSFGVEELKIALGSLFINNKKERTNMKQEVLKGKILVIDDDHDFIDAVTVILKSASYDVVTANNPKEGQEKILTEKPDLILLDIMMDSIFDGYSLCNAIKTSEEFKEFKRVPVIFVSAVKELSGSRFSFHSADQGMVGPDDYLDKPVRTDELIGRIEKFLKKH
ncbi:MAG: hypothetical protein A2Y62_08215 [Candidatus Fischerbacteria bacterium RBG_13_37_8]|uniref:Response regulatory domain-containing protein n=1 Tax=Candidatus Fischerbacteria bacterium RBG_13_37_8 TaxID=1817863 RepID=A0A1F5V8E3_9BACT|nr:MAG: hypothetical protein A2Y62_08215 [Candidatus Fischerbacteria bacterium RBG_13_37_8]